MKKLFKIIKLKKKNHSGFTFMETLIAILILLMVSAVVAAGVPTAANAYKKVVVSSNAEVLLSTTVAMLRNEIGTAEANSIKTPDENTVYYHNAATGGTSKIFKDDAGMIMYQRYAIDPDLQLEPEEEQYLTPPKPLVSYETATDNMFVTYESVDYDEDTGFVKFTDIIVKQGTKELTSFKEPLVIRII